MDPLTKNNFHWSHIQEVGTLSGLRLLHITHKYCGRKFLSLLLAPIVIYFFLFKSVARKSSLEYLRQHANTFPEKWQKPPGNFQTLKHFYIFSESIVDKLLAWCTDIDSERFIINDINSVETLLRDKRGQLIIGSHFGNLEYCRGFMQRYKNKVINILVHDKHSTNYNTLMQQLNPDSRLNIFQVEDFDVGSMLLIKNKIDNGEWVFIAGDRTPLSGSTHTTPVNFLGKTAQLPIGPYLLAKGLHCPVKLMFSYCDYFSKGKPIYFDLVEFSEELTIDRKHRDRHLQSYAQQFAKQLEIRCKNSPYHWFNFYHFWPPQYAHEENHHVGS